MECSAQCPVTVALVTVPIFTGICSYLHILNSMRKEPISLLPCCIPDTSNSVCLALFSKRMKATACFGFLGRSQRQKVSLVSNDVKEKGREAEGQKLIARVCSLDIFSYLSSTFKMILKIIDSYSRKFGKYVTYEEYIKHLRLYHLNIHH